MRNKTQPQSMFDRNYYVRRDFISNPRTLRKRLMVVGLGVLLLSPFLVIFMLVYLFLRHAEQFYNHPSTASSRRWSNLSRWIFREFNEVDHLFKHRINNSVVHASGYLKQFPSPIISIIAKFISFVSGGFAAILISIAFLEESLLEGHMFGRNLFWYAAVFGTITAISRAAITNELLVLDPEGAMSMVVQHTHYMPKRWRGKESIETVRMEFETLFQYTGMMLLEEMASIFLTPFLLLFVVPKRVEDILQFIADFTVNVDGVGHICSFSTFDFQNHGNSNYGSPYNTPRPQRSCQGKMEKSFLSFKSSYPSWEPSAQGKQFLVNLRTFREQNLAGHGVGQFSHSPPRKWPRIPNFIGFGNRHTATPRDMPFNTHGFHLGSLWLIDDVQRTHPYLLDCYYTFQHNSSSNPVSNNQTESFEFTEQQDGDLWLPSNLADEEGRTEEYWVHQFICRSGSQLGASTSAPAYHESVFQHHDSSNLGQPTRSHWWARTGSPGVHPQTSFLEPPNFNQYQYHNFSERSLEQQEQYLDWSSHRLSKTTCLDDYDLEAGGGINLHFDDVYSSRPSESPTVDRELPSL